MALTPRQLVHCWAELSDNNATAPPYLPTVPDMRALREQLLVTIVDETGAGASTLLAAVDLAMLHSDACARGDVARAVALDRAVKCALRLVAVAIEDLDHDRPADNRDG